MDDPDGAEANIRQSTTPTRIDLNRDWENFAQPESRAWYAVWSRLRPRLAIDLHHMDEVDVSRITAIPFATHGECGRDV
jgi:hypothetical protein